MANLLPAPVIRSRVTSAVVRTIAAFSVVIALSGVVATISLVPAYLQSHITRTTAEKVAGLATTTSAGDLAKQIVTAKTQMAALKTVTARQKSISNVIKTLIEKKPDGMYIEHLTYKYDPKSSTIMLREIGRAHV